MLGKTITTKIFLIFNSILIVTIFFFNYPIAQNQVDSVISSIFAAAGIFIAFLLTFIFAKVSSIRSEKEERKKEIDKLSYKVTEFRRALYYILTCRNFWGDYSDIENLKRYYSGYTYIDLHTDDHGDQKIYDYWLKEDRFSTIRSDLFLGIEEIVGRERIISWVLDENLLVDYSSDDILRFYDSVTVLWYYFSHKWEVYGDGRFNFYELYRDYNSAKIKEHLSNIDGKFQDRNLDRHLLADIGSDMHEKYLPKFYDLTYANEGGLPTIVNKVIGVTILVGFFGVILPLLGSFANFPYVYDSWIVFVSVTVLIACIIWILFDLVFLMKSELKV